MVDQVTISILIHLLISGVSVVIIGKITPGIQVRGLGSAVLFTILVALLNALLWNKLEGFPGIPQALSSSLGSLLANGLVFYLAGKIAPGIEVSGCITAGIGAFFLSFTNGFLYAILYNLFHLKNFHRLAVWRGAC